MKFYSEKLDKLFDTPEQLEAAETGKVSSKKKRSCSTKCDTNCSSECSGNCCSKDATTSEVASPTRKELAIEVETAEKAVVDATAEYELAKQKVQELSKKYLEDVDAIMNPAKEKVKKAQQEKYAAIKKFNDSYGSYQVTYTGDKAAQELIKTLSDIDSYYKNFFRILF